MNYDHEFTGTFHSITLSARYCIKDLENSMNLNYSYKTHFVRIETR